MNGHQICLVVAAISFGMGAANLPNINWVSLGLMFVTLGWLVGGG